jgi:hypothetical protein
MQPLEPRLQRRELRLRDHLQGWRRRQLGCQLGPLLLQPCLQLGLQLGALGPHLVIFCLHLGIFRIHGSQHLLSLHLEERRYFGEAAAHVCRLHHRHHCHTGARRHLLGMLHARREVLRLWCRCERQRSTRRR